MKKVYCIKRMFTNENSEEFTGMWEDFKDNIVASSSIAALRQVIPDISYPVLTSYSIGLDVYCFQGVKYAVKHRRFLA